MELTEQDRLDAEEARNLVKTAQGDLSRGIFHGDRTMHALGEALTLAKYHPEYDWPMTNKTIISLIKQAYRHNGQYDR